VTTYLNEQTDTYDILGKSDPIKFIRKFVKQVGPSDANIVILGESGVGKELVARAIHQNSHRKDQAFVAVNCAALTESLIESQLFGHEKGAFTGALKTKAGCFEKAQGGTLFLDEIGELALKFQAKLLRVIEERVVERIGAETQLQLDVRIISATNTNLEKGIAEGWFRADLYYRLNVICIIVPPLRMRKSDIPALVDSFISRHTPKHLHHRRPTLSHSTIQALEAYNYPGNVRELSNIIQRAMVLSGYGPIELSKLPDALIASIDDHHKGEYKEGSKSEYLLKSLKKIIVRYHQGKPVYWHEGLRCVTVEQIYAFLIEQGRAWFSRKSFEAHLRCCSKTDAGKYKTAGVYLNIMTTHNICIRNGRKANQSAYRLHDRFISNAPADFHYAGSHFDIERCPVW
jgi:transcriptional regulator with PAS, ATPase and Fis domain